MNTFNKVDSRTALPQYYKLLHAIWFNTSASNTARKMFEFHEFNRSTGFLATLLFTLQHFTFTLMYAVHIRVYTQT